MHFNSAVLSQLSLAMLGLICSTLSHAGVAEGERWLASQATTASRHALDLQSYAESLHTLSLLQAGALPSVDLDNLLQNERSTEGLARAAMLAHFGQQSPSIYFNLLKSSQNTDGGFGHLEHWQSNPLDTAFVLLALHETQFIQQLTTQPEKQIWQDIIRRAVAYLRNQQRSNGSYQVYSLDQVYVSAYVLTALTPLVRDHAVSDTINRLVQFLQSAQVQPAQWTTHPRGLFIDALVAESLHPYQAQTNSAQQFAARATQQQQSNGSWFDDPYITALVLRSLARQAQPINNPLQASIRLQVIDSETQLPLPNVQLLINQQPQAQSDLQGQLNLNNAPTGVISVVLQRDGYNTLTLNLTLRQSDQLNLGQIQLSRTSQATMAQIQGQIFDAVSQVPVAGAQVTVVAVDSVGLPLPNREPMIVFTNADGRYQVVMSEPSGFGIDVRKAGYAPVQGKSTARAGTVSMFSPKLYAESDYLSSACGEVRNEQGQPLAGVQVLSDSGLLATTDAQGLFRVSGIAAGSQQWRIVKQSYQQASVSLILQPAQEANIGLIRLPLAPVGTDPTQPPPMMTTGKVIVRATDRNSNRQISGITIIAERLNAAGYVEQTQSFKPPTNNTAEATLLLSTGYWLIRVQHPAYKSQQSATVGIHADTQLTYEPNLVMLDYRVQGRVVDSQTNQPIANAPVRLVNSSTNRVLYTGVTNSDGQVLHPYSLSDDQVQLEVNPALYLSTVRRIDRSVQSESIVDLGEIRLRPQLAQAILPDLKVTKVDAGAIQTDAQRLRMQGELSVTLESIGRGDLNPQRITVMAFEDTNHNRQWDEGEQIYATQQVDVALTRNQQMQFTFPVSGKVRFREAPIAVWADTEGVLAESNKANNIRLSGDAIEIKPPIGTLDAEVSWRYGFSADDPNRPSDWSNYGSSAAPVAAPLFDTNSDGVIGAGDRAAIIYVNYFDEMVVLDGLDGSVLWKIRGIDSRYNSPVIADVDGNGLPEVIVRSGQSLLVYSNTGVYKKSWSVGVTSNLWLANDLMVGDLDGDGTAEIVVGNTISDYQHGLKTRHNVGAATVLADLTGDGRMEIIGTTGVATYTQSLDSNNAVKAETQTLFNYYPSYFSAVADLLGTGSPNIVLTGGGRIRILTSTGQEVASHTLPDRFGSGAPTIGDFDGNGFPEIGVAGYSQYVVMRSDGSVLWSSPTQDNSSNVTGSGLFDFDGDGQFEVVYADEQYFRIYDAATGTVRYELPNSQVTAMEYPIVVDANGDGQANILFTATNHNVGSPRFAGIRMLSSKNKDWARTRNIWNQYSYHVTNINDDLSVPRQEVNSWEAHNTYRANLLLNENATVAPDLTTSYLRINDRGWFRDSVLTARIGNAGGLRVAAGVPVSFYVRSRSDNSVRLIETVRLTEPLQGGHYIDLSINYDGDMSDFAELIVVANDAGAGIDSITGIPDGGNEQTSGIMREFTRSNNRASLGFSAGFGAHTLSGSLDKPVYQGGEIIRITATVENLGIFASSNQLQLRVIDSSGQTIATLPSQTVTLSGSLGSGDATAVVTALWPVGGTRPSGYQVVLDLVNPDDLAAPPIVSTSIPFDVVSNAASDGLTQSFLQVDKTAYAQGDSVQLTARIQNSARNQTASARQQQLELIDPTGQVIWSQQIDYTELPAEALQDRTFSVPLGQAAAGRYTVRLTTTAPDGSQSSQIVNRSFDVQDVRQTGVGLSGNLQAPSQVEIGQAATIQWGLQNQTQTAVSDLPVRIIAIDPETGERIGQPILQASYSVDAQGQLPTQLNTWATQGSSVGQVILVLEVQLSGATGEDAWRTVAHTDSIQLTKPVVVVPPIEIEIDTPTTGHTSKPVLIYYGCQSHQKFWVYHWAHRRYIDPCFDQNTTYLKQHLDRIKVPYTMVKDPAEFRHQMHSGLYGQYWVLGTTTQTFTAHTFRELRETSYLGDQLLIDSGQYHHANPSLFSMAGAKYRGMLQLPDGRLTLSEASSNAPPTLLRRPSNPQIADIPIDTLTADPQHFNAANRPLHLDPISAATQTAASFSLQQQGKTCNWLCFGWNDHIKPWIESYPAILTAPYGRSQPIALAFDLSRSLQFVADGVVPSPITPTTAPNLKQQRWDDTLQQLLTPHASALGNAQPRSSYVPRESVQLPIRLNNPSDQPQTVYLAIDLPIGAMWRDGQGGISSNTSPTPVSQVRYPVTIAANTAHIERLSLHLPSVTGTHALRVRVLSAPDSTEPMAEHEQRYLVRSVEQRSSLLRTTLNGWSTQASDRIRVHNAVKYLGLAEHFWRKGENGHALFYAGLLTDELIQLSSRLQPHVPPARIEADELLRALQIEWHTQRQGQHPAP